MGNTPSSSSPTTGDNHHHQNSSDNNGGSSSHNSNSRHRRSSSGKSKTKKSSDVTAVDNNRNSNSKNSSSNNSNVNEPITARASKVVGDFQAGIVNGIRKLEEQDHPAAALLDSMCGPYLDPTNTHNKNHHVRSSYSEEMYNSDEYEEEEEDSRTVSEEETTVTTDYHNRHNRKNAAGNNNNTNNNTLTNHNNSNNKRIEDETTTVDSRSYVSDNSTTLPPPHPKDQNTSSKSTTSRHARSSGTGSHRRREESSYDDTEDDDDDQDTFTASRVTTATSVDDDEEDEDDRTENDTALSSKLPLLHNHNNNNNNKSSHHYRNGGANNTSSKAVSSSTNTSTGGTAAAAAGAGLVSLSKQPLASSFAKRCYFTKSGIGGHTQHYEGLTLTTGNVILMLAAAMKLKGCPTICDEDLRRVEQTYPNQFSRLPDELLLSSGWRRISKYCHFSNKPIPDGIPFFHSRQRLHPTGGYYFLLASAVGMVRPIDVEPLNRDTLVLLETDYPTQCDMAPSILIQDPDEWTVVDKFCFFSGGPINTDEDVYYMADFDGNPIYMLAFLSPSLTPSELYKLDDNTEPLRSSAAVEEVESVYDLTERDFDDLKLYHLGPCRALPQYILQPSSWTKVLPPHFLAARESALIRSQQYEEDNGIISSQPPALLLQQQQQQYPMMQQPQSYMDDDPAFYPDNHHPPYDTSAGTNTMRYGPTTPSQQPNQQYLQSNNSYSQPSHPLYGANQQHQYGPPSMDMSGNFGQQQQQYKSNVDSMYSPNMMLPPDHNYLRNVAEEGAFMDGTVPIDEAIAAQAGGYSRSRPPIGFSSHSNSNNGGIDPPEDEPPSLRKRGGVGGIAYHGGSVSSADPSMNSPQYESSPHNEPISPPFEPSPSDFDDEQHIIDEAIRYDDNREFHDDQNQYFPPESGAMRYQKLESRQQQQQQYDPHDEYINEQNNDEYERSPEYASDEKYEEEEDAYQYDHADEFDNKESYHDEPNTHTDNEPNSYQPRNDQYYDDNVDQFDDITPQPSGVPYSEPGDDIDYDDNGFPVEKEQATSPTNGSEFSAPTMNDDGFSNGLLYMSTSTDDNIQAPLETTRRGNVSSQPQQEGRSAEVHHFPPVSPRSGHGSEYSQSSAMRGAQELLRRNRQKRLELAMKMKQHVRQYKEHDDDDNDMPTDENQKSGAVHQLHSTNDVTSPQSQDSGSTWHTGVSEYTGSEVTGGSSIWTETENNPDRSSRRALILQMARARMKNQGGGGTSKHQQQPSNSDSMMNSNTLEEKKLEHIQESSNDIDFAVDLD